MLDAYHLGGWGMYPTTLFGTLAVALLARAALNANRPVGSAIWGLLVATGLSGLLGFTSGVIRTFQHIQKLPEPDQYPVTLIGVAESAHNLGLALVFGVLAALLFTLRGLRERRTFAD